MKLQKDDPRLLQFVLNEISIQDRKVVEAAIFNQMEIAKEIEALKKIYKDISDFESQPSQLRLSSKRRENLFAQTIEKQGLMSWVLVFKNWRYTAGGLVAATFAVMIFTHSLKKEVSQLNTVSTVRPTIPADSEQGRGAEGQLRAQEPMGSQTESQFPPARSEKSNLSEITSDKDSENELIKGLKKAAPAEADEASESESLAQSDGFTKKKLLMPSKQSAAAKAGLSATKTIETFGKATGSGVYIGSSGSTEVRPQEKSTAIEVKNTQRLQVLISSRALESEQIKTMTATVSACLEIYKVSRELKVAYEPHINKYTIINSNPSTLEKDFASCGQKAFVQLISPYIKTIYVELKAVP